MALAHLPHRIRAWLADDAAAYADGVALLRESGTAPGLARLLARGEDARRWAQLQEALRAAVTAAPAVAPSGAAREIVTRSTPSAMTQAMPAEIAAIDAAWRRRYKAAADRFRDLKRATSDRTRAAYAAEILDAFDEIRPAWAAVDHWREHGTLPPAAAGPGPSAEGQAPAPAGPPAVIADGLAAVVQRLINLPTYCVKHRQRAKRAAEKGQAAQAAEHLARVRAYEDERRALFQYLEDADRTLAAHH